ncbi:hypothetical protein K3495_g5024 [Podosphaera aphanis]|nr:hypothetical protein K3495_g5024 [Podosphaera aphanis]
MTIPQGQASKITWTAVARNGLRQSARSPVTKAASAAQKPRETPPKTIVDKQLFLQIEKKMHGEIHR